MARTARDVWEVRISAADALTSCLSIELFPTVYS